MKFLKNIWPFNRPKRRKLKYVKIGDRIVVEWNRIQGGIGKVTCIGNDPVNKKMYISIRWDNHKEIKVEEYERHIWSYKDSYFKNFYVLNQQSQEDEMDENDHIEGLKEIMRDVLKNEEYELATEIRNKLTNLISNIHEKK